MLALSPRMYSSNNGWASEEHMMSQGQNTWTGKDPLLSHSFGETQGFESSSSQFLSLQPQMDFIPSSAIRSDQVSIKKLNHNASERDRRKKLNNIYASLRATLPGIDQTRQLSIPATISRALKYIPELQNQVEKLKQRKQEILSCVYKKGSRTGGMDNQSKGIVRKSIPSASVSQIDEKQVMIQICAPKNMRNKLSEVLLDLEEEGLEIFSVSSSASSGELEFYNLHLQTNENQSLDCELLSQKLLSMCESKEELF